jgi:hypothetical protein
MRLYPKGLLVLAAFLAIVLMAGERGWGMIALTAAVVLGILVEFSPFFMRDRDQKLWPRRRG